MHSLGIKLITLLFLAPRPTSSSPKAQQRYKVVVTGSYSLCIICDFILYFQHYKKKNTPVIDSLNSPS